MRTQLLEEIEKTLISVDCFLENSSLPEDWTIKAIKKVLLLMKDEFNTHANVNQRLLRAMKDVYVVSYRNYEGTEIHENIKELDKELGEMFWFYDNLTPLGMDFGKGNPI